ncbi:ribonuclease P/MRP protein subunit POP5-like [Halichondria panicea]|uniref:ribonuclease P/MRP protein subunit POP5-like n=1 Tax=Halichondria panicea TaxID=6063 RepID=UPI00312B8603
MVRYKNRYLLLEVKFPSIEDGNKALKSVTPRSLASLFKDVMAAIHGDYGLACVLHSINVKYLNVLTRVVILRCPRDHHKAVWAAVATITQLEKTPCAFRLLHLAGTIRSCQRQLVNHNRTQLREMIRSAPNPMEKRKLQEKVDSILMKDSIQLRV